ncbi:MAG: IPT/TIG domain-containing protein [Spirosomataceae bacterium]
MKKCINSGIGMLLFSIIIILFNSCSYLALKDIIPLKVLRGKVFEVGTNKPIERAQLEIKGKPTSFTDAEGNYFIEIDADIKYEYKVSKEGYLITNNLLEPISRVSSDTIENQKISLIPILRFDQSTLIIETSETGKNLAIYNTANSGDLTVTISYTQQEWLKISPEKNVGVIEQNLGKTIAISINRNILLEEKQFKIKVAYESNKDPQIKGAIDYNVIVRKSPPPVSPRPIIDRFFPEAGPYNTEVVISGQNFDTDTSKIAVTFNGKKALIKTPATSTELRVLVPVGAKTGTIKIKKVGLDEIETTKPFIYELKCVVNQIAATSFEYYINDITTAPDGTVYFCGITANNAVANKKTVIYKLRKGSGIPEKYFEREAGYKDGNLGEAQMVNPTKIIAVNNDLYIIDQLKTAGYTNLRKISSNGVFSTLVRKPLIEEEFTHDLLYIPKNGSILYTDGYFHEYDLGRQMEVPSSDVYQGLSVFLDFDGNDIYSLDLDLNSEKISKKWELNRRPTTLLGRKPVTPARELGISSPNLTPENTNYPKGMVVDPENKCAYIIDRNGFNYRIYRIYLDNSRSENDRVQIVYDVKQLSSYNNGDLVPGGASFASISCLTYDANRQSVLFIDASPNNQVIEMICK